jgi:hypothetical protein
MHDQPGHLFPNAQRVELFSDLEYPLNTIFTPSLVLSASVKSLTLTPDVWLSRFLASGQVAPNDVQLPEWLALGGHIADVAPHLSSFTVEMAQADEDETRWAGRIPPLLEAFTHFSSRLCTLNISPLVLTAPAITALGQLSGLTKLHLSLFDFQTPELHSLQQFDLEALEQIAVDTISLPVSIRFFQALCAKQLRKLELRCLLKNDTDPASVFTALHACGSYSGLSAIHVYRNYGNNEDEPFWDEWQSRPCFTFSEMTAKSLVPFKRLEKLSVAHCRSLELADADIQEMFSSWPSLKVLELEDDNLAVDYQPPRLTLAGVHKALQNAPLLQSLTLSFDGSVLPPPTSSAPHPSLTAWDVGSSSIAIPSKLAAWLSQNYPLLSTLEFFPTYMEGLKFTYNYRDPDGETVNIDSFEVVAVMVDRWTSVRAKIGTKGNDELRGL